MVLSWVMDYKGKKLAARDLLAKAERFAEDDLVKGEIKTLKAAYQTGNFNLMLTLPLRFRGSTG